jgi:peptidoglycan/xylan/chitin deacetylase (PgdA/CDA1 family)
MLSVRRHLHILIAEILYYSGCLSLWRFLRTPFLGIDQVCVFGLHRVLPDTGFEASNSLPGMRMKESTFASLLQFVRQQFRVVSLSDIDTGAFSRRCAFTFDDGWRDNYAIALPLLRKYNIPATIFLVAGFIGGEDGFWVERLVAVWRDPALRQRAKSILASRLNGESAAAKASGMAAALPGGMTMVARADFAATEAPSLSSPSGSLPENGVAADLEKLIDHLKRMPSSRRAELLDGVLPSNAHNGSSMDRLMSWDEVTQMSDAGVTFGAHTMTHPLLPYEDEATAEREIRDARLILEEKLHKPVRAFAYPNGEWTLAVRDLVSTSGYEWAFTTKHGWYRYGDDRYTIPRVLLHEGNVIGRDGKFSPAMFMLTTVVSGQ